VGDSDQPASDLGYYAEALADGIAAALPTWVVSSVERVMVAWTGGVPAEVAEVAEAVAQRARDEVGRDVHALLVTDIDEQWTTPLALLRRAVRYPTELLRAVGVPPVERDVFSVSRFPDDYYDLSPSSFADFDPDLAELAITWGAAKAFEHRRRHRPT
jgi:uncharacterized protein (DUF1800 family)